MFRFLFMLIALSLFISPAIAKDAEENQSDLQKEVSQVKEICTPKDKKATIKLEAMITKWQSKNPRVKLQYIDPFERDDKKCAMIMYKLKSKE